MRLARRRSSTRRAWSPRHGGASTGSGPRSRRSTSACAGSSRSQCPRGPSPVHEVLDDAARILDESIAQARPQVLRVHRIQRARGRRDRRSARPHLRHQPGGRRQGGDADRGPGGAVGLGVRRVPGHGRRVHQRGHREQRHRARGRPRASGAGRAPHGARGTSAAPCTARRRSTTRSLARSSCSASARTTSGRSRSTGSAACVRRRSPRRSVRDVAAGVTPVAVVATAGTTLTGAIDPIDGDRRRVRGASVSGSTSTGRTGCRPRRSSPGRRCSTALDRADSCSIDAHKWLYLPKACGVVLVRDDESLANAFSHEQGYLPHQQHELHAADITLEYSRPFRALKLWLAFRAHGAAQFREAIDRNLAEAELLYRRAQSTEDFEVMEAPPQLSIVPLRHVPPGVVRPERAQPGARRGDPGRRAGLPRIRPDRRRGLAATLLRQLPHDRERRARPARRRAGARRAARTSGERGVSAEGRMSGTAGPTTATFRARTACCRPSAGSATSSATCRSTSARCGRSRTCSAVRGDPPAHGGEGARPRSPQLDLVRRACGCCGSGARWRPASSPPRSASAVRRPPA